MAWRFAQHSRRRRVSLPRTAPASAAIFTAWATRASRVVPPPPQKVEEEYVVQKGDSWAKIAGRFGVDASTLNDRAGLSSETIAATKRVAVLRPAIPAPNIAVVILVLPFGMKLGTKGGCLKDKRD